MRILDPSKSVGSFGKWLAHNIYCSGMSIGEFASVATVDYHTVFNHIYMKCRPSITIINIYCKVFNESDPWSVYEMALSDWESKKIHSI